MLLQDQLEAERPDIHATTSYTSLEISSQLAAKQQQTVLQGSNKHTAQFQVVQQDAASALAWHVQDERPCVILMMEVLDNMPHDRLLPLYTCSCRHPLYLLRWGAEDRPFTVELCHAGSYAAANNAFWHFAHSFEAGLSKS